ncbi:MAG: PilZ domain-containing protein [Candidatus Eremiobacteraeota bacterium]|nr:PilZ domain-containing protein [Candidatus Eremiobacteraeota bacterium]
MLRDLFKGLISLVKGQPDEQAPPEERRHLVRLKCCIPVELFHSGEGFSATVVDMGMKGMQVRTRTKFEPGAEVSVMHGSESPEFKLRTVRCKVVWCRARRFSQDVVLGVSYHDSNENLDASWIRYLLNCLGLDETTIRQRRQHIRVDASIMTDIYHEEGNRLASGQLVNMSLGGCLVQIPQHVEPSTPVSLEIGPFSSLPVLKVKGKSLDSREDERLGGYLCSVEFNELEAFEVKRVGDYVIRLLQESSAHFQGS